MVNWPYKMEARTRFLLARQASNDRRNIRPIWLWVFRVEESPLDEIYLQTSRLQRRYMDPLPAHLYVEMTEESEWTPAGMDRKRGMEVSISLAETYRLAQELGDWWTHDQYIPRAQDLFQWRGDLYEFQDSMTPKQFWGTTDLAVVFSAPAAKWRLDSTDLEKPVAPMLENPPLALPPELGGGESQG